jgi:hypothetical protein
MNHVLRGLHGADRVSAPRLGDLADETLPTSGQRHLRLRRHALPGGDVELPRRGTAPWVLRRVLQYGAVCVLLPFFSLCKKRE